ncbi:DUF1993 family protein [Altererythrobacter sp. GH1-8]|uniref:DUF1993 domain-containing protein n=1 Tax=Altererythrobacter sp. GH1-8 TaxID=3349333 RepID=UPI00374DE852
MPLTLYEAFVPGCQQMLAGLNTVLGKGEAFAEEQGIDASELIEARLAENMWTLPWHVRSCWVHSGYAVERLEIGAFTPDFTSVPDSWDAMRAMIADAQEKLSKVTAEQLEAAADKPVPFVMGGKTLMTLTGQNMLLSFNQPNIYFHASTFYGILRMKGVPLGKMDFMGPMRIMT